jgi:hypothetical protein
MAWYRAGIIAFHTGEWALARQEMERAVALMRQVGLPYTAAYVLLGLGRQRLAEGRWTAASALLDEADSLVVRSGDLQGRRAIWPSVTCCRGGRRRRARASSRCSIVPRPQSST